MCVCACINNPPCCLSAYKCRHLTKFLGFLDHLLIKNHRQSMRIQELIHMVPHAFLLQNANPNGPVYYIYSYPYFLEQKCITLK